MIFPDADGQPDTTRPYKVFWWVSSVYGWSEYNIYTTMLDTIFWVIVEKPPGALFWLGADSTRPDGMSYTADTMRYPVPMNHQYNNIDVMIRVVGDSILVLHDVTAIGIIEPFFKWIYPYGTQVLIGDTIVPKAFVGNCGASSENFDVMYTISDTGGIVYGNTIAVNLGANQTEIITFNSWIPTREGNFTITTYTRLQNDEYPANDTTKSFLPVSRDHTIFYDCGISNMFSCTIPGWATNRKHLVKFTPTISPPFLVKGARILIDDSNSSLEYVSLCVDDGGLPDTTAPLAVVRDVTGTSWFWLGKWAEIDFGEIERIDTTPLWLVAKYLEGASSPKMAIDQSKPVSGHSWRYYYKDGAGHWDNHTFQDWIMHLVIGKPPQPVEELVNNSQRDFSLSLSSNPSPSKATIYYQLPIQSDVGLNIYDISGQLIRKFISKEQKPGLHTVVWDGRDNNGKNVSTGIYFCRLTAGNAIKTEKLILLRTN